MKIHGLPISPPTQVALLTALQLDADVELVPVDVQNKQHKTPEFLKLNPRGQMPTLTDGDFSLGESVAIQRYILNKVGENPLYPTDIQKQAKADQIILNATSNLSKRHGELYFGGFIKSQVFKQEPATEEELKALKEEYALGLETLKEFLAYNGGPYLAGENLTAGDLNSYAFVNNVVHLGVYSLDDHPEVKAWFELVEAEKGPQKLKALKDEFFAAFSK